MEADSGIEIVGLKVDGGASANNYLMQAQANFINAPVVRPTSVETTAGVCSETTGAASTLAS